MRPRRMGGLASEGAKTDRQDGTQGVWLLAYEWIAGRHFKPKPRTCRSKKILFIWSADIKKAALLKKRKAAEEISNQCLVCKSEISLLNNH